MSPRPLFSPTLRPALVIALSFALAGCSDKPASADGAAAEATQATAAEVARQQASAVAALTDDELRTRGRLALRERRIHSPAGGNAMEYYIALRKKSAGQDGSAESALVELQPYAVIAAEQALGREDFIEAERLRDLIAAADPQAPSLPRITDAIAKGKLAVAAGRSLDPTGSVSQAAPAELAGPGSGQAVATVQPAVTVPLPSALQTGASAPPATNPAMAPVRIAQAIAPVRIPQSPAPPTPDPPQMAPAPAPARLEAETLVPVRTPTPEYPRGTKLRVPTGTVVASFTVNADGSVGDIDTQSVGSRHIAFERSVRTTLRHWKYQPIGGSRTETRTFNFAP